MPVSDESRVAGRLPVVTIMRIALPYRQRIMKVRSTWLIEKSNRFQVSFDAGPHPASLLSDRTDYANDCQEYQSQDHRIFNCRSRLLIT
jgi:hypothetical protein